MASRILCGKPTMCQALSYFRGLSHLTLAARAGTMVRRVRRHTIQGDPPLSGLYKRRVDYHMTLTAPRSVCALRASLTPP